jgi:hypothetical protein
VEKEEEGMIISVEHYAFSNDTNITRKFDSLQRQVKWLRLVV